MREQTITDLWVGIFIIAVLGIFAYFIATFTAGTGFLAKRVIIKTEFKNLAGLKVDGPVKLEGYSIGRIVAITHPKNPKEVKVVIEMEVDEAFLKRIEKDALATIETEGMLGDVTVEIKRGNPENGYIKPGEFLASKEKLGMFEDALGETKVKIDNILGKIDEKGIEEISSLLKNLSDITAEIKEGDGPIHTLLYDKSIALDLKETINNVAALTDHIEGILNEIRYGDGSAHALIYGNQLKVILRELEGVASDLKDVTASVSKMVGDMNNNKVGESFGQTAENLKKISENLAAITNSIKEGEGTVGLLMTDPTVFEDLKVILGGAKRSDALRFAVDRAIKMKRKEARKETLPEPEEDREPAVVPQ